MSQLPKKIDVIDTITLNRLNDLNIIDTNNTNDTDNRMDERNKRIKTYKTKKDEIIEDFNKLNITYKCIVHNNDQMICEIYDCSGVKTSKKENINNSYLS